MPVTPAFSSDQERVLEQAINSVMENWLAYNNSRVAEKMSVMNS
jgi:hypothetical protein